MSPEELPELLSQVDADADGEISFAEFDAVFQCARCEDERARMEAQAQREHRAAAHAAMLALQTKSQMAEVQQLRERCRSFQGLYLRLRRNINWQKACRRLQEGVRVDKFCVETAQYGERWLRLNTARTHLLWCKYSQRNSKILKSNTVRRRALQAAALSGSRGALPRLPCSHRRARRPPPAARRSPSR